MIAARDPFGFRPLVLGKLKGATVVASETCALDLVRAEYIREVEPGEVVIIDEDGMRSIKPFPVMPAKRCIFEYVYFSRPDSLCSAATFMRCANSRDARWRANAQPRPTWWFRYPIPAFRPRSAMPRKRGCRLSSD